MTTAQAILCALCTCAGFLAGMIVGGWERAGGTRASCGRTANTNAAPSERADAACTLWARRAKAARGSLRLHLNLGLTAWNGELRRWRAGMIVGERL